MNGFTYARRQFNSLRFSVKLFIGFLILCLIPLLIITQIYYALSKSNIQANSSDFIQLYASQLQVTLNNYVTQIENTSRSIFSDHQILHYIGNESRFDTSDKIHYNLMINRMLGQFSDQLPYVDGIMLISKEGRIYSNGGYPEYYDTSVLPEQDWYRQIIEANGQLVITPAYLQRWLSGRPTNVFTAGRLIKNQEGHGIGAILFNLHASSLMRRDHTMNEISLRYDARIVISNEKNQFIYDSSEPYIDPQGIRSADYEQDPASYLTITKLSDARGLNVTVMVPKSQLYGQVDTMKTITTLILILSILIIAICSVGLSYQFTKPLHMLTRNMKRIEQGYYHPIEHTERTDEIGTLIMNYNLMIMKIKHLIEDVYQAQIRQNEARYLALQNQINPHWLNNTLESIRMKAHVSGASEIAFMIKTLGRLFRLALSHPAKENRIANEIEYIELYTYLQNIRYENLYSLAVDLDERYRQYSIITLVFQPIIENSIIHGFWDDSKRYTIRITAFHEHDTLTIRIFDDGMGMSPEKLQAIRQSLEKPAVLSENRSSKSIGLRNVHERIQLHYGAQYGLTVESAAGEGTAVCVTIPFHPTLDTGEENKQHGQSDVQSTARGR